MGQSASKAAARAARKTAEPASNISATAAAAEATQRVKSPSFRTPASPQDLAQEAFLRQQQGLPGPPGVSNNTTDTTNIDLPADLVDFLKDAGPLQSPENQKPSAQKSTPRAQPTDQRLAANIPGYHTTKTTNFSRQAAPVAPPVVYQAATCLDLYRLVAQKLPLYPQQTTDSTNAEAIPEETLQGMVDQTYQAYGQTHTLPAADGQATHQQLLQNTLRYLDVPVVLQDPHDPDSYSGIPPRQVDTYTTLLKYTRVPPTRARLVLEDLDALERPASTTTTT